MAKFKNIKFEDTTLSTYVAADINVSMYHFESEKAIRNFLQNIDQWTYSKNKNDDDLLLITHSCLNRQSAITDVVIYREEMGIMVLAYSDVVEAKPSDNWKRWLRMTNKINNFNFTLYEMSRSKIKDIENGTIPLPIINEYILDKNLTNKYGKLGVFF